MLISRWRNEITGSEYGGLYHWDGTLSAACCQPFGEITTEANTHGPEDCGSVNSLGPVTGQQAPLSQVRASPGSIGLLSAG